MGVVHMRILGERFKWCILMQHTRCVFYILNDISNSSAVVSHRPPVCGMGLDGWLRAPCTNTAFMGEQTAAE